jgi:hypothetical protein
MVELQIVAAPTSHARPESRFQTARFTSEGIRRSCLRSIGVSGTSAAGVVSQLKLELENASLAARLFPGVHEVKGAIEGPDVGLDLLVDIDELRRVTAISMSLSGLRE